MSDQGSGCGTLLIVGLVIFGIAKCAEGGSETADYSSAYTSGSSAVLDLDEVRENAAADAVADLGSSTYQNEVGSYGCTDDCGGHDAGWEWAANNEITDNSDCYGQSASFEEGCQAFAEEVQNRSEAAAEDAEADAF